jgi:acyl carrier protein
MTALTEPQIRDAILGALGRVAPEADLTQLDPDVSFRDQLDVDSVDLLNFVIGINEALGVEIPEAEYPRLGTLNRLVRYLSSRLSTR